MIHRDRVRQDPSLWREKRREEHEKFPRVVAARRGELQVLLLFLNFHFLRLYKERDQ